MNVVISVVTNHHSFRIYRGNKEEKNLILFQGKIRIFPNAICFPDIVLVFKNVSRKTKSKKNRKKYSISFFFFTLEIFFFFKIRVPSINPNGRLCNMCLLFIFHESNFLVDKKIFFFHFCVF